MTSLLITVLLTTSAFQNFSVSVMGVAFWGLGLYLGWSPWADRLVTWGSQRLPVGLASLLSVIPFLALAAGLEWFWQVALGRSWSVSFGILMCIGSGLMWLGRQDQQDYRDRQDPGK